MNRVIGVWGSNLPLFFENQYGHDSQRYPKKGHAEDYGTWSDDSWHKLIEFGGTYTKTFLPVVSEQSETLGIEPYLDEFVSEIVRHR